MATAYLEAVTGADLENGNFDPKVKQKQVYKYYDSRYSDEALDIFSEEWENRIIFWHQRAVNRAAETMSSDELLETLDFGSFFLAHPIAAFSLWQVLQACYELDRAVCGDIKVVSSWEQLKPFEYLRDAGIQSKWHQSLDLLKEQIKNPDIESRESWEFNMYEILQGVERFEDAFQSLKENFSVNLVDMKCAKWMIDRIEEDIGKRFSMIDRLLEFKESELANIRPTDSNETNVPLTTVPLHSVHSPPPPKYRMSWNKNKNSKKQTSNAQNTDAAPLIPRSTTRTMSISGLKTGMDTIKAKYRKMRHKKVVKSLRNR